MTRPSFIVIDGKPYRWRDIQQLRREQLTAIRQTAQLPLFAHLPEDSRSANERTASDRYQQPSLFTLFVEN